MAYTTINKSNLHFNTILRTGNYSGGGGTTAITGVGFAPGLMWEKKRNGTSIHALLDQVRGNGKQLQSETTGAETTTSQYASIDSDGFTVNNSGDYGTSSNLVSWHWKAGTTGSGTTGGSGTSKTYNYSVNTTGGFSIVKYEGNGTNNHQVPHHLGAVPKMIIFKNEQSGYSWDTYHVGIGNAHRLYLNSDVSKASATNYLNSTTPTSTYINLGDAGHTNHNGTSHIAYCFAEKTGYSKFGSYTGNGNADGTFIYTGFKPKFVMVKNSTSTQSWYMLDTKRDIYNPMRTYLFADGSSGDQDHVFFDFYSNGFKARNTVSGYNSSGDNYIYMAFGQSLVGSNNVPCTAR